jgi:hypothetical protein
MLKNIKREKAEDIVRKLQVISKIGTKHLVPILKKIKSVDNTLSVVYNKTCC